ncbi:MAG: exodeoxyribonuclease V subunit gamma [Chlamydiota bacterium]|nr:exodeoxyribonuclease V subunit gamma [Chlamydiota bacterium]
MEHHLQISLSNRVEVLYDLLVAKLFTESPPFSRRIVIVPSPAMKAWLTVKMANDPRLNICTGIEIHYLEDGLNLIYALASDSSTNGHTPSSTELSLKIELELKNILKNFAHYTETEKENWAPLFRYLKIEKESTLSLKSERRLISLSEKLAHLFQQYGRYGAMMLSEWEDSGEKNWQAELWRLVFCDSKTSWTYPYRQYNKFIPKTGIQNIQLHLFAVSYLSKLQCDFLQELSKNLLVENYFLSPCSLFWSDVRSDKERIFIQKYWNKKNVNADQERTLEELLRDRNRLLANFGRLGREMAVTVEESETNTKEYYVANHHIQSLEQYSSLYFEDYFIDASSKSFSLLQAIQSDMLALRTVDSIEKINIEDDSSIQIHIAPNKLREVQILHDNLMRVIEKHAKESNPLTPSDIIVLTPDILEYEPYIKAVFGSDDSTIGCQIMDLKIPAQSRLIQAFLHILALPESRWDAKIILELFEYQNFQRKHNFSFDDVQLIRSWIKKSGILWGENAAHRDEILRRNHCQNGIIDKRNFGTWEYGLDNLIKSIAVNSDIGIDQSQTHTLGKFTEIIHSLRSDLKPLTDGSSMEVGDWISYLECILDAYLSVDLFNKSQESEYQQLKKTFENIQRASLWTKGKKFRFISIQKRLENALLQEHVCYRENHIQSVKFCSMLPMRAIPSRVVAILGMEEGAYPKQDMHLSLNALSGREDCDFCPKQVDYDRYLFLEVLLSAREYLLLNYSALSIDDGKEQAPSLLIDELLSYLDEGYRINDRSPSSHCISKHPYYAFDQNYYTEGSKPRSYSHAGYLAAKSYYSQDKLEAHKFIKSFSVDENTFNSDDLHINVIDLSLCIRNPLRSYFNQKLGIYIRNDNDQEIKTEEDFVLSPLDNAILRKSAIKSPIDEVIEEAHSSGKFPIGLFGEVATEKLKIDSQTLIDNMRTLNISTDEVYTIHLSEHCQNLIPLENGVLTLPAIEINSDKGSTVITGFLTHVCSKGLIAFADDRAEDIVKIWPEYVIMSYLIDTYTLDIQKQVIPMKNKKCNVKSGSIESPLSALNNLIDLYRISIENPSPMIPEWIPDIINGNSNSLDDTFNKTLYNAFKPIYNDYLQWIIPPNQQPDAENVIDHWNPYAIKSLSTPFQMWYPDSLTTIKEEVTNE